MQSRISVLRLALGLFCDGKPASLGFFPTKCFISLQQRLETSKATAIFMNHKDQRGHS